MEDYPYYQRHAAEVRQNRSNSKDNSQEYKRYDDRLFIQPQVLKPKTLNRSASYSKSTSSLIGVAGGDRLYNQAIVKHKKRQA